MRSFDIAHVPPPNPENFWWFNHQQRIDYIPGVGIQLIAIDLNNKRAMMNLILNDKPIRDYLEMDAPVVALRLPNGEPLLTLTLRDVEKDRVALQVTGHPDHLRSA